jgi:hypothetical protein
MEATRRGRQRRGLRKGRKKGWNGKRGAAEQGLALVELAKRYEKRTLRCGGVRTR